MHPEPYLQSKNDNLLETEYEERARFYLWRALGECSVIIPTIISKVLELDFFITLSVNSSRYPIWSTFSNNQISNLPIAAYDRKYQE